MFRRLRERKGSLIVDAAACMPAFIIAMGMMLSLISLAGSEDNAFAFAVKAASANTAAIAVQSGTEIDYGEEITTREGFGADHVLTTYGLTKQTSLDVKYRPFVGASKKNRYVDDVTVYIFPKRGERYHCEGCQTMKEGCVETVLTSSLMRRYSACKICKPDKLFPGSRVYMYSGRSSVYHRKSCATITKTFEGIPRGQAEEMGYTPCKLCGGGR